MKKGKDLKVGDVVTIYGTYQLNPHQPKFRDTSGIITEIVGYKSTVFVDGRLETWVISDLKKMAARKQQMLPGTLEQLDALSAPRLRRRQ